MTPDQRKALQFIRDNAPCAGLEIGRHVGGVSISPRSASAKGLGLAWELIRAGYATRQLMRRELYAYSITLAGREALRQEITR